MSLTRQQLADRLHLPVAAIHQLEQDRVLRPNAPDGGYRADTVAGIVRSNAMLACIDRVRTNTKRQSPESAQRELKQLEVIANERKKEVKTAREQLAAAKFRKEIQRLERELEAAVSERQSIEGTDELLDIESDE